MKRRGPMSLRQFAAHVGVSHSRIVEGVASGRLARSIGRDARGRPVILDAALARREWTQNAAKPPTRSNGAPSLVQAQVAQAVQRTRALRLSSDEREGLLVPLRDVEALNTRLIVAARTELLGLPTRLKQRRPEATRELVAEVDRLVREALENLAAGAAGAASGVVTSPGNGHPHEQAAGA